MKNILAFLMTLVLFTSCNDKYGERMDLIWIPIVFAVVSVGGLIKGIQLSKSGASTYDKNTGKWIKTGDRYEFFGAQNYGMVVFVSFLIAAVATYFYMRAGN